MNRFAFLAVWVLGCASTTTDPFHRPMNGDKLQSSAPSDTNPEWVTTRSGSLRQPGPEEHSEIAEPAHPTFAEENSEGGSSIDPNRVYRGAREDPSDEETSPRRYEPSNFSETGVPRSTSEFRGRRDSAF